MKFWIFVIFIETFLEQSIWICKWVSWWCHRLTIFPYFSYEKVKLCLISTLIKCRIIFALIYFDMGTCCYMFEQKNKTPEHVQHFVYKIHRKLWGDDIINSLICIFISTVREVFRWKLRKIQSFISSLFFPRFTSNFHCCIRNVLLFLYRINLNLDRTSPLNIIRTVSFRVL